MKISKEDVIHVAHLARLELDEAAVEKFSHQIGTILDYVDTLNRLDTTGVSPTSHAIFLTMPFARMKSRSIWTWNWRFPMRRKKMQEHFWFHGLSDDRINRI